MSMQWIGAAARHIVRQRRAWTAAIILLGGVSFALTMRLETSLDEGDFLPARRVADDALEADVVRAAGGTHGVVVVLEGATAIASPDVERIFARVAAHARGIRGVRAVHYRPSPELLAFIADELPIHLILHLHPDTLRAASLGLSREGIEVALGPTDSAEAGHGGLRALAHARDPLGWLGPIAATLAPWEGTSRMRLRDGYHSLVGGHKFFLLIELQPGAEKIPRMRMVMGELERALQRLASDPGFTEALEGRRLYALGRPISNVRVYDVVSADVRRAAFAAAVVVSLELLAFFRRPLAPVLLGLAIALGLALTAAGATVLTGSVNIAGWMFVAVLVGLGIDFGIHIAAHYWLASESHDDRAAALAAAVARPGRGVIIGGLTSVAAFLSLQVFRQPVMKEIAWLSGLGLLAILVSSFRVLPWALSWTRPGAGSDARLGHWLERACGACHPSTVLVWPTLALAAMLALPFLRFEPNPWQLMVRADPATRRLERLSHAARTGFTPVLLASSGATAAEAIARDREAAGLLLHAAQEAGIASIESLSRWYPPPERQRENLRFMRAHAALFSPSRFRADFDAALTTGVPGNRWLTEEYASAVARSLPNVMPVELTIDRLRQSRLGAQVDRHLLERNGDHLAVSYVHLRTLPALDGSIERFLDAARRAGVTELPGVSLLGEPLRKGSRDAAIGESFARAAVLALIVVVGLLWNRTRRIALVALCVLPAACGVAAVAVAMAGLDIELNLLTLSLAPILLGIGIDDGIHMVERFRVGQSSGTVLREAGSCMTMTTITTVSAFGCLGLASFEALRDVAVLGAIGITTCLIASLQLIPLLWSRLPPLVAASSEPPRRSGTPGTSGPIS